MNFLSKPIWRAPELTYNSLLALQTKLEIQGMYSIRKPIDKANISQFNSTLVCKVAYFFLFVLFSFCYGLFCIFILKPVTKSQIYTSFLLKPILSFTEKQQKRKTSLFLFLLILTIFMILFSEFLWFYFFTTTFML